MTDPNANTKLCPQCNIEKHVDEFEIRIYPTGTQAIHSWCRKCDLAYHAKWKRDRRKSLKEEMKNKETVDIKQPEEITPKLPDISEDASKDTLEDMPVIPIVEQTPIVKKKIVFKKLESEIIAEKKSTAAKEYYQKNRETLIQKNREYKEKNKEKIAAQKKEYFQNHKDEIREKRKKYLREYYLANKDKIHEYINKYRSENPEVKLRDSLRSRLLDYIYKEKHTEDYLGSPVSLVKKWIESNFTDGMLWSNHGSLWQLDHTIAISQFDLKNENDMFVCFNWMNLYPMLANENKIKHKRMEIELINARKIKLQNFCIQNDLTNDYNTYIQLYDEYIEKFT